MRIDLEHVESSIPVPQYAEGYIKKRRVDSGGSVERSRDGSLSYTLPINVPSWVKTTLRLPDMYFHERVEWRDGRLTIDATCAEADVRVHTTATAAPAAVGGGTCVKTRVDLTPSFRGIPVPEFIVHRAVQSMFTEERRRDAEFARSVVDDAPLADT